MQKIVPHKIIRKKVSRNSNINDFYAHIDVRTGDKIGWNDINRKLTSLFGKIKEYRQEKKNYYKLENKPEVLRVYKFLNTKLKEAIQKKDTVKIQEILKKISKLPWENKNKYYGWDLSAVQDWQFFNEKYKLVLGKIIRGNAHGRILDIGSGSWNYFSPEFNEIPFPRKITAIDTSKEMLLRSEANKRIKLDLNEINKGKRLPFDNNEFDTLNLSFIVNYLDLSKLDITFKEFNRITNKGGTILISGDAESGLRDYVKHQFNPKHYIDILNKLDYKIKMHTIFVDVKQSEIEKSSHTKQVEFCKLIIAHKPK